MTYVMKPRLNRSMVERETDENEGEPQYPRTQKVAIRTAAANR